MRNTTDLLTRLALLALLTSQTGCAFLNGRYQSVRVSSNVPARIYAGDLLVAETDGAEPAKARLRRGKGYVITAKAPGYQDVSVSLTKEFTVLGTLDLLGALIIALPAETFASGHAYGLEPSRIHLDLERLPGTPPPQGEATTAR